MGPYPNHIKKLIFTWKCEAHERELHRELRKLDALFAQWRVGEIGSGDLAIHVEDCWKGPIKELLERYNTRYQDSNVAYALVTGILSYDEVPEKLVQAVSAHVVYFEDLKARGDLRMPGE
ncbi:MAG TPA: hypothetical protein PLD25_01665 [Chloroflexota bacterium]|nr:hypothetical protein [Chloroflexota bacterium]HUM68421.1 hypothetical protein [Chloroflexota bacterium]